MSSEFEDDEFGDFEGFEQPQSAPAVEQTANAVVKNVSPEVTIEDVAESDEEFDDLQAAAGVSTSPMKLSAKYQCSDEDPVLSEVPSESGKFTPPPVVRLPESADDSTLPESPSKSFSGGLDEAPLPVPQTSSVSEAGGVQVEMKFEENDQFGDFGQFEGSPVPSDHTTAAPNIKAGKLEDNNDISDAFDGLSSVEPETISPAPPAPVENAVSTMMPVSPMKPVDDDPFAAFDDIMNLSGPEIVHTIVEESSVEDFGQFEATPSATSEVVSSKPSNDLIGGLEDNSLPPIASSEVGSLKTTAPSLSMEDDPFSVFDDLVATSPLPVAASQEFVGGLDGVVDLLDIPPTQTTELQQPIALEDEFSEFGAFEATPVVVTENSSTKQDEDVFVGFEDNIISEPLTTSDEVKPPLRVEGDLFSAFDEIGTSSKPDSFVESSQDGIIGGLEAAEAPQIKAIDGTSTADKDFEDFGTFETTPTLSRSTKEEVDLLAGIDDFITDAATIVPPSIADPIIVPNDDPFGAFDEIGSSNKLVEVEATSPSKEFIGGLEAQGAIDVSQNELHINTPTDTGNDEFGDFGQFESTTMPAASTSTESTKNSFFELGPTVEVVPILSPIVGNVSPSTENDDPFGAFDGISEPASSKLESAVSSIELSGGLEAPLVDIPSLSSSGTPISDDDFDEFGQFEATPTALSETVSHKLDVDFLGELDDTTCTVESQSVEPNAVAENINFEDAQQEVSSSTNLGDVQDDAALHASTPNVTDDDDFGDFGNFEGSPLPEISSPVNNSEDALEAKVEEVPPVIANPVVDFVNNANDEDEFGDFGEFEGSPVPDQEEVFEPMAMTSSAGSNNSWQVVDEPSSNPSNLSSEAVEDGDDFGDFGIQSSAPETSTLAPIPAVTSTENQEFDFGDNNDDDFGDFGDFSAPVDSKPIITNISHETFSANEDPFGSDANGDDDDFGDFGDASPVPAVTSSSFGASSKPESEDAFGSTNDDEFDDFAEFSSAPVDNNLSNKATLKPVDDAFGSDAVQGDDDWDAFSEAPTVPAPKPASSANLVSQQPTPVPSFSAFDDGKGDDDWDKFEASPASFNASGPSENSTVEFTINTGNPDIDQEVMALKQLVGGSGNASNEFFAVFAEMSLLTSSLYPSSSPSSVSNIPSVPTNNPLEFDPDWLDNIFDGKVPATLESAPLTPWCAATIEKILSDHIPPNACSVDELKNKIESESLKMNYLAAKNREVKGRRIASSETILNRSDSNQEIIVKSSSASEATTKSIPSSNNTDWDSFAPRVEETPANSSSDSSKNNNGRRPSVAQSQPALQPPSSGGSTNQKPPPAQVVSSPVNSATVESDLSKAAMGFLNGLPDLSYILK